MTIKTNIFFLILFFFITGCNRKNNVSEDSVLENDEERVNLDSNWKERFWIRINDDGENSYEDVELYVTDKKDTLFNQNKYYVDGMIDSTKSNYYDLEMKEIAYTRWFKGKIKLHSNKDTVGQNYLTYHRAFLTFIQNEGDSIYVEKYDFSDNYEVEFQFTPFNDDIFMGYIWEVISIHDDPSDPEKGRMQISTTFVDNKNFTKNPFFDNITDSHNLLD